MLSENGSCDSVIPSIPKVASIVSARDPWDKLFVVRGDISGRGIHTHRALRYDLISASFSATRLLACKDVNDGCSLRYVPAMYFYGFSQMR